MYSMYLVKKLINSIQIMNYYFNSHSKLILNSIWSVFWHIELFSSLAFLLYLIPSGVKCCKIGPQLHICSPCGKLLICR